MRVTGGKKGDLAGTQSQVSDGDRGGGRGRLSIVGIGPGSLHHLTPAAKTAIDKADVVAGYSLYLDLISSLLERKQIIKSGMGKELERAQESIDAARRGKQVAFISSGDPGVYGMAGPALELLTDDDFTDFAVEVIPGVTSATMAASLLGAPLMHDFCAISLSDLLTDLDLILKRVEAACDGDFVIVLYNPKGKKRTEPFRRACDIMIRLKGGNIPVGVVREAGRPEETTELTTLARLPNCEQIDMKTTVIVGNRGTFQKGPFLVTPRGYKLRRKELL